MEISRSECIRLPKFLSLFGLVLLILTVPALAGGGASATPIGAWFGIARPCTPPPTGAPIENGAPAPDFLPDPTMCEAACGGDCEPNAFPLVQVTMIPTLLADGTVLADDFGELFDNHTTAHGKWEYAGKVRVDGQWMEKYQATFVWFTTNLFPVEGPAGELPQYSFFGGSVRPRFVTFFDKFHPDRMRGYIQPYYYPYTTPDGTIGRVDVADPENSPFPFPNPADPLPSTCNPGVPDQDTGAICLGTLHFNIQRIPAH